MTWVEIEFRPLRSLLDFLVEILLGVLRGCGETRVLWPDLDVPDLKITIIAESTDD